MAFIGAHLSFASDVPDQVVTVFVAGEHSVSYQLMHQLNDKEEGSTMVTNVLNAQPEWLLDRPNSWERG
jgi:hypothetical protein